MLTLYNLICISLNSYLKNLRHHRLNSEPEKLKPFLERIERVFMIAMEHKLLSVEDFEANAMKIHAVSEELSRLEEARNAYRRSSAPKSVAKVPRDRLKMYRSDAERTKGLKYFSNARIHAVSTRANSRWLVWGGARKRNDVRAVVFIYLYLT